MPEPAVSEARRPPYFWLGVLAALVLAGLGAPWLAPYAPNEQPDVLAGRLRPPLTVLAEVALEDGRRKLADRVQRTAGVLVVERLGESERIPLERVTNLTQDGVANRRVFLLGSDKFSRDVLSRLLYGARISFFVGVASILLALTVGLLVGAAAAMGPRALDALLMRTVDGLLAFPTIFLLIALMAVLPPSPLTLIGVIAGTSWMSISRLVRSEILSLRERDFVLAARGLGAGPAWILLRHLLPNTLTPLVVDATLRIGQVILVEATLSFLGLGIQPPQASWGNMISDGRGVMFSAWWVAGFPCLALVATVIALSLASDHLRRVLDPRSA